MYKVFVNENPIILTEKSNISTDYEVNYFSQVNLFEIVEKLFRNKVKGICLISSNLKEDWKVFKNTFKIQEAAGGKVLNNKNEVLFIYRFDKWDLPKGKLERGESIKECAVREVEEECGISGLKIEATLSPTYHIFERKGKLILKITHWFLMNSTFEGSLTPQFEEGIEQVEFKNEFAVKSALNNTYENIKLLFN